ncbi:MAG TPA: neutral/alkaline non-lysosomal ceramidase N-terminal domain-containing protein [Chryseosolibacter sp.]|nr:neutral/alkaline non-lysosomal ceramidase N-terminal domain-containing protein [Chryseosolibacter sp.]
MKSYSRLTHYPLHLYLLLLLIPGSLVVSGSGAQAQNSATPQGTMAVGVARIDITPDGPIRLAGYGARRKTESDGIIHRLGAKALAFGTDSQNPTVLITVDLLGIPGHITRKLGEELSKKAGIDPANLVIYASHTHGAPEVGNALNILQYRGTSFSDSLLALEHMLHISTYTHQLIQKLEQVALAALKDRRPALVAWGQGQANFAKNRRTQGGPVDPSLPILRVTDPGGKLRAVLVNYACHGTTLSGDVNQIHGDWMAEAQKSIEARHTDATALIAIGCAGDANPDPRGKIEDMQSHGQEIATNVDKLLASPLQPLSSPPTGRIQWVKLPFSHTPTVPELIAQTQDKTVKGYYARLALDRLARGQEIPRELAYPIQVFTFGNELVMVNLAGEVVVDYSIRLKNELGAEKLWVNAYANDVPCYIASRRVIREGGYEAESSMYWYDKPAPFAEEVEDIIISAVHELMPASFKEARPATNHPELIRPEEDQVIRLTAEKAQAVGPEIKYMPEWRAFGWFTERDRVEWDVEVASKGKYDVYLDWSVSDEEAGKPYVLEAGRQQVKGTVGKSGSWFTYRTEKIGRLQLSAGSHKVIFRPASASKKGALLDLRELKLVRVK